MQQDDLNLSSRTRTEQDIEESYEPIQLKPKKNEKKTDVNEGKQNNDKYEKCEDVFDMSFMKENNILPGW